MTRAQTMGVVNDATDIQNEIDAVLKRLMLPVAEWDWSEEITWLPGEPLWPHPKDRNRERHSYDSPTLVRPHGTYDSLEFTGGNHVRYMMEIVGLRDKFIGNDADGNAMYETVFGYDDTFDGVYVDCDDCQVGIGDQEVHCWVCGEKVRNISRAFEMSLEKAIIAENNTRLASARMRSSRQEPTTVHNGVELRWQDLDWAINFLDNNPDRHVVRVMRVSGFNTGGFEAATDVPMTLERHDVALSRADVIVLRNRLWRDLVEAGYDYAADTNEWRYFGPRRRSSHDWTPPRTTELERAGEV